MPHDTPEPAGEGSGIGEAAQPEPGGHEGLLHDVLGVLQVAHEGQRIAEGHVLEAPRELAERVEVAVLRLPGQRFEVHRPSFTP